MGHQSPPRRHINDGKPGERSVSMACMHLYGCALRRGLPVSCFYTNR